MGVTDQDQGARRRGGLGSGPAGKPLATMRRRIALCAVVVGAMAAMAPVAEASLGTVGLTLSPASATAASTGNLGTDITFNPSSGDSTKDLTLGLPPGLLANAAVDGGACLKSATPVPACQVGTGTVTANILGGLLPLSLPATFDLVAPANSSQLAGLAVLITPPGGQPTQLGAPAGVTIRPATDPAGVGLNIAFTNIPDTFDGLPLQLHEINGTFDGLRFPSSCPATPVNMTVTADSYQRRDSDDRARAPDRHGLRLGSVLAGLRGVT